MNITTQGDGASQKQRTQKLVSDVVKSRFIAQKTRDGAEYLASLRDDRFWTFCLSRDLAFPIHPVTGACRIVARHRCLVPRSFDRFRLVQTGAKLVIVRDDLSGEERVVVACVKTIA
jgi:hypothetical protein